MKIALMVFAACTLYFSHGKECYHWCKSKCPSLQYYCCNYDMENKTESFISDPCEKSETCQYWCRSSCRDQTYYCCSYDPLNAENSLIPDPCGPQTDFRCPTTYEPNWRNCLIEVNYMEQCKNNDDCKNGEICCSDLCLREGVAICKQLSQ